MNKNLKNQMMAYVENENYMALRALLESKTFMTQGSIALESETFIPFEDNDEIYLDTSPKKLAKDRIAWLLVLMISATLTGTILQKYEHAFFSTSITCNIYSNAYRYWWKCW